MNIYIDTEFNDFGGDLISLAMVDEEGREFYAVLNCQNPSPWVAANVMPVLGQPFASLRMLQTRMEAWLAEYPRVHIVADWPEDIAHFCRALITGPGMRIDTPPLTMEVRRDLDSGASVIPHNALEDARAIWRAANGTKKPPSLELIENLVSHMEMNCAKSQTEGDIEQYVITPNHH